jgi:hypothetical protein
MTIFDLLLILIVLASAAGLIAALVQTFAGNRRGGSRTLMAVVSGIAIYLVAVCSVSLSSTEKIKALGEPDCSDDWCVTPETARLNASIVTVEFRVSSRAKRVTQREFGLSPYIKDNQGHFYRIAGKDGPEFDRPIAPAESFVTSRTYRIDPTAETISLVMRDGFGPATFVIGASQSLLHPRTVYKIKLLPESA